MDKASRDPVLLAAAWVAGIAAAVASYSALYGLAVVTGWSPRLAWLLPLCVDSFAVAALRVWLSRGTPNAMARLRARRAAVLAIAASVGGNVAYHASSAGVFHVTWPVVVAVSAVPPVTLGLVSHLFSLWSMPAEPEPEQLPEVPPNGVLASLAKADAIRLALAHCGGVVLEAQAWLAERGISADRAYMHDVKRGVSGKGRRHRREPELETGAAA
jgi:hypothetical protein